MQVWPDPRLLDMFGIELPIIQAPMAGANGPDLVVAVCKAGGLGSLPCALLTPSQVLTEVQYIRTRTKKPINLNFFCHPVPDLSDPRLRIRLQKWRALLESYYTEAGLGRETAAPIINRATFDSDYCTVIELLRPEVVSFHFGLPECDHLNRVRATGARIISSATTVEEALWLEAKGVDAVIAMGGEAGGHRASFLHQDMSRQIGTFALVPQIADAVKVPVIAAGGVMDGRGIVAALVLGASAVQMGTAYLLTPESTITDAHRNAIAGATSDLTQITNIFTGRPARGISNRLSRELGAMRADVPDFPLAGSALAPLKATVSGEADFANMWAGQGMRLTKVLPARELTIALAKHAAQLLGRMP